MPSTESNRRENSDGNELTVLPGGRLPDEEAQIGGDTGSIIQASVQQQNNSDDHDPQNNISPDEETRLWEDLKAETGYASYDAYLEAYEEPDPYLKTLKEDLDIETSQRHRVEFPTCSIFNNSNGDDSHPRLNLHCRSSSGLVILSTLRQPLATVAMRIVLWDIYDSNKEMVNALGLGLKIQPRFFQDFFCRQARNNLDRDFEEGEPVPSSFSVGHYLVTIARHYLPAHPDTTPVVLIAKHDASALAVEENLPFRDPAVDYLYDDIDR